MYCLLCVCAHSQTPSGPGRTGWMNCSEWNALRPTAIEVLCGLSRRASSVDWQSPVTLPLNPQLPTPLSGQRAGSAVSRIPSPVPAWLTRRIISRRGPRVERGAEAFGDDLDGLGCRGMGVGPAGDLVEGGADAGDLPGALSLRLAGADLHPHVASSANGGPLPLGGSEGAQPPNQPLPGTREAWPRGVCGSPEAQIKARNHVSRTGTARSAVLAARSEPT